MISIDEARRYVFSLLRDPEAETTPLDRALGCVAAAPIIATEPVPGFANSSMDGYALRASDTSSGTVQLRIVDSILAGRATTSPLGAGEAVRIMTGAPLPPGADSVEMLEEVLVDASSTLLSIHRRINEGNFVRRRGEDIGVGDELLRTGTQLHATRIGVLASQGIMEVLAYRRPRVGVVSTGNEVSDRAGPLESGSIRDVNRPLLLALVSECGAVPIDLGLVSDDLDETRRALASAAQTCDVVISSGGVSVGDVDFIKIVIGELGGANARSMQVAVRPGKPFAFGVVGPRRVPIFGLPGNPVSARVSFELFVRPSIRKLAGHSVFDRLTVPATLDCELPRIADGKIHMVHVTVALGVDGRVHVLRATREGSHLLHAIANANAIAAVPDGAGLNIGDTVRVIILHADDVLSASANSDI